MVWTCSFRWFGHVHHGLISEAPGRNDKTIVGVTRTRGSP